MLFELLTQIDSRFSLIFFLYLFLVKYFLLKSFCNSTHVSTYSLVKSSNQRYGSSTSTPCNKSVCETFLVTGYLVIDAQDHTNREQIINKNKYLLFFMPISYQVKLLLGRLVIFTFIQLFLVW